MTAGLVPVVEEVDERLGAWAATFLQIASVSAELARTPFVPASLRVYDGEVYDEKGTAANVSAAILTGQEVGLEPMASLRSIHVINATPAMSALALRALAQRHGHGIWLREATNTRAIVEGLRAGDDESRTQRIAWTTDDARSRGLLGRPNWRTMPRNMLIARATSEVVRLVAADAILGIPYSIEELEDGDVLVDAAPNGNEPPPAPPRKARRRRAAAELPAAAEEPPAATGGEEEPPAPPAGPGIQDNQKRALHAGFRDLGITDRTERLRVVRNIINRSVRSSNELTAAEASSVLDYLNLQRSRRGAPPDEGPPRDAPPDDEPDPDA